MYTFFPECGDEPKLTETQTEMIGNEDRCIITMFKHLFIYSRFELPCEHFTLTVFLGQNIIRL